MTAKKKNDIATKVKPRVLPILEAGISTAPDFAKCMSALMSDIVTEAVSPQMANAIVNAGGKLLKVVEMQQKYGKPTGTEKQERNLVLVPLD